MKRLIGRQAVVVGAGIAGLAAARAVADFVEHVVVLERDKTQATGEPRPGVPQGRQPHVLLAGGLGAFAYLLPGIEADLHRAGALPLEAGHDARSEIPDVGVLPQRQFGIRSVATTRPILEQVIARRVAAQENITFRRGARVVEVVTTAKGENVVGVRFEDERANLDTIEADLVIDASGRGGVTMACIAQNGLEPPRETKIGIDLGYATGIFTFPPEANLDFTALITYPMVPESSRSGLMMQIGQGRWQVILAGRGDELPPATLPDFLVSAELLPTRTIASALRRADSVGEIAQFRFGESVWRHFGVSGRLPGGLIPIGDAICRFNPVYGQGMSIAAIEGKLLHRLLATHAATGGALSEVVAEFLGRANNLIEPAWRLSAVPDLAFPGVSGDRPADLEEQLLRKKELFQRAMHDDDAHRSLVEALHLTQFERAMEMA
ncbi:FAD-dependent oxidoreductase [Enterovirga sp. CN4-39]|uniref:FAD-dependent oxidoreductase n=1 Tax=Enterovirga sp. CN4-39 TaxID=3400910 RepID=UPI003C06D635